MSGTVPSQHQGLVKRINWAHEVQRGRLGAWSIVHIECLGNLLLEDNGNTEKEPRMPP